MPVWGRDGVLSHREWWGIPRPVTPGWSIPIEAAVLHVPEEVRSERRREGEGGTDLSNSRDLQEGGEVSGGRERQLLGH